MKLNSMIRSESVNSDHGAYRTIIFGPEVKYDYISPMLYIIFSVANMKIIRPQTLYCGQYTIDCLNKF